MAVLFMGIAAYIVYAIFMNSDIKDDVVCGQLTVKFKEDADHAFLDKAQVEKMLRDVQMYPVGKQLNKVNLRAMEDTLRSFSIIEEVECYKNIKGNVGINITQRTPILYVMPDNSTPYYIDSAGVIMTGLEYKNNLPVATGRIRKSYSSSELADFAAYVYRDEFWDSQIEQIVVRLNKRKHEIVELIPRVGAQKIMLGPLDNYEKKLERLRIFYDKVLPKVGWNKYSCLNLEYANQVICTKTKN